MLALSLPCFSSISLLYTTLPVEWRGVEFPNRNRQIDGGAHRQRHEQRDEGHGERVHPHATRRGEGPRGKVAAEPEAPSHGGAEGAQVGSLEQQRRALRSRSAAPPQPEPQRPQPRLTPARRERHRQPLPLALVRQSHAAAAVELALGSKPRQ